jgi:hypothetical protein
MSTKNVVGEQFVSPVTASWYYVSGSVARTPDKDRGALQAVLPWLGFQLSRLTPSLFDDFQTSAVLAPVPVRKVQGRQR